MDLFINEGFAEVSLYEHDENIQPLQTNKSPISQQETVKRRKT